MNFHWRKRQLANDVSVLDRESFFHGLAFHPFGGERGAGDGRAASEGLELGLFDDAGVRVDFHLQLHNVAAFRSAHEAGADIGIFLVERANVARIVVMLDYFIAVSH